MLCYKDMTFCCAKEHKPECDRQFTKEDSAKAERWWGGKGAPISFHNFCGGDEIDAVELEKQK